MDSEHIGDFHLIDRNGIINWSWSADSNHGSSPVERHEQTTDHNDNDGGTTLIGLTIMIMSRPLLDF